MKLSANPADWLVLQFQIGAGNVSSGATSATLETGQGGLIPAIPAGEWIAALAVDCSDPETVMLSQLRLGDWVYITSVTGDVITMRRSGTARTITEGEYLFFPAGAFEQGAVLQKLKDIEYALSFVWGGGDGVPRLSDAADALQVVPTVAASMAVKIKAGFAWIGNIQARVRTDYTTGLITAPAADSRIDLVELVLGIGGASDTVTVKTGTQSSTPTAPTVDSGAIALAEILMTYESTTITSGMITDRRTRV